MLLINEIVDKKLLQCVGKAWRHHRCQLKRDHKKQGKTKQDMKDIMLGNLVRDQWIKLVVIDSPRDARFYSYLPQSYN